MLSTSPLEVKKARFKHNSRVLRRCTNIFLQTLDIDFSAPIIEIVHRNNTVAKKMQKIVFSLV